MKDLPFINKHLFTVDDFSFTRHYFNGDIEVLRYFPLYKPYSGHYLLKKFVDDMGKIEGIEVQFNGNPFNIETDVHKLLGLDDMIYE